MGTTLMLLLMENVTSNWKYSHIVIILMRCMKQTTYFVLQLMLYIY